MKVLHVVTGLNNGGAEGVLYRLCKHEDRHQHVIISMMDEGKYGGKEGWRKRQRGELNSETLQPRPHAHTNMHTHTSILRHIAATCADQVCPLAGSGRRLQLDLPAKPSLRSWSPRLQKNILSKICGVM